MGQKKKIKNNQLLQINACGSSVFVQIDLTIHLFGSRLSLLDL